MNVVLEIDRPYALLCHEGALLQLYDVRAIGSSSLGEYAQLGRVLVLLDERLALLDDGDSLVASFLSSSAWNENEIERPGHRANDGNVLDIGHGAEGYIAYCHVDALGVEPAHMIRHNGGCFLDIALIVTLVIFTQILRVVSLLLDVSE